MRNLSALLVLISFFTIGLLLNSMDQEKKSGAAEYREIAKNFTGKLSAILMKTMRSSGPAFALSSCADSAQIYSNKFSAENGVIVKRTSFKIRNQLNAPDEYEAKILNYFESLKNEGALNSETESFEEIDRDGKRVARYLKPIIVKKPCLNCHGDKNKISSEVKQILNEKYPDDSAVNYKVGDLRGAVSISKTIAQVK